jgi:predicted RNA binding protein YcfA (HicA-like mRNA interferase family)
LGGGLDKSAFLYYSNKYKEFSMTFREIEKLIKADGWYLKAVNGSHFHYEHNYKAGKLTIPFHSGDIPKRVISSILKQAGLK